MRNLYTLWLALCLAFTPLTLFAAEAVPETLAGPWWVQAIWAAVAALFALIASPWLLGKAKALREEAAKVKDDIKSHAWLSLQAYTFERVEARFKRDGFELARLIASGAITDKDEVKKYLRSLGQQTKYDLVTYWKDNFGESFGVSDLYAVFGEKYIDELIESAANKVWARIPGFEVGSTADTLIQGGAKRLVSLGLKYADRPLQELLNPSTPNKEAR